MKQFNQFDKVMIENFKRSSFDGLAHTHDTSFRMGHIVPIACEEVIPGEPWQIQLAARLKFAPLIYPTNNKVYVDMDAYFIPSRILWPGTGGWEAFQTDILPDDYPTIKDLDELTDSSLGAYLGLPLGVTDTTLTAGAMQIAACEAVYNQYYRQKFVQTAVTATVTGGDNPSMQNVAVAEPRLAGWYRDYFTAALNQPQTGATVKIPLGGDQSAELRVRLDPTKTGTAGLVRNAQTHGLFGTTQGIGVEGTTSRLEGTNAGTDAVYDPLDTLAIDDNTYGTIRDLRVAEATLKYLELQQRAGASYEEQIRARFGVPIQDSRMQNPEFIGRTKMMMEITEVVQTSASVDSGSNDVPLGSYSGHGVTRGVGAPMRYRVPEHGYIMIFVIVRPETIYFQGLDKQWSRRDRYDYLNPEFAQIGEQEIKLKELWAKGTSNENEETFGYIPRYSEYMWRNNKISGKMATTLNAWHVGRDFASKPTLGSTFLECDPTNRIFAAVGGSDHQIFARFHLILRAVRQLPKYNIPG